MQVYTISVNPKLSGFYSYNIKFSYDDKKDNTKMRITIIDYETYLTDDYKITDEFGAKLFSRACSTDQIWTIEALLRKHCESHENGIEPWSFITLNKDATFETINYMKNTV